ncbi:MAG: hypothetical protein QW835_02555 [Candidatus Hadarchaeum sp.]
MSALSPREQKADFLGLELSSSVPPHVREYVQNYRQILEALAEAGIHDPEAARVILQELGKDRRMREAAEGRQREDDGPVTDRQRKFLERKGVVFPSNLTKLQASEIITKLTAQTSTK